MNNPFCPFEKDRNRVHCSLFVRLFLLLLFLVLYGTCYMFFIGFEPAGTIALFSLAFGFPFVAVVSVIFVQPKKVVAEDKQNQLDETDLTCSPRSTICRIYTLGLIVIFVLAAYAISFAFTLDILLKAGDTNKLLWNFFFLIIVLFLMGFALYEWYFKVKDFRRAEFGDFGDDGPFLGTTTHETTFTRSEI